MYLRKPKWIRSNIKADGQHKQIQRLNETLKLNTVCTEALCPNRYECWEKGQATYLILGAACTRNCSFCNVTFSSPQAINPSEPANVAKAIKKLKLKHVVITSVTRDDLPDGGASCFADSVMEIRNICPATTIEILIPDFQGKIAPLFCVLASRPDVLGHNVETVPRLYSDLRKGADYSRSLGVIAHAKTQGLITKSALMLGLGETEAEIIDVLKDLHKSGCDIVHLGQYLAPSKYHTPVARYYSPESYQRFAQLAESMGFAAVQSGPLVRSSFASDKSFNKARQALLTLQQKAL